MKILKIINMKILKFGGTSVGNAKNIQLVLKIIQSKSFESPTIVVVSAFSGVTDLLLLASEYAANKDIKYKEIVA